MSIKNILIKVQTVTIFAIVLFTQVNAFARQPDIVITAPTPIAVTKAESFAVYFQYGNIQNDTDIRNATASITTSNNNIQFVTTGFKDFYNGDPNRPDTDSNIPAQPLCNKEYNGPIYSIKADLASANNLVYGLQSARNASAPSGASVVDKLRAKATGCIKVELKVATGAVAGPVDVIFDEDAGNGGNGSADYQTDNRPSRQIIRFNLTGTQPVASSKPAPIAVQSSAAAAPVVTETARTGGPGTIVGFSIVSLLIIFYIAYSLQKRSLTKISTTNSKKK